MEKNKVINLQALTVDDIDDLADRIDGRIEKIQNIEVEKFNHEKILKGAKLLILLYRMKSHLFQTYHKHVSQQASQKNPSGGVIHTSGYVTNQETIEHLKRLSDDLT